MIDLLIRSLDKEMTEAGTEEKDAQADYEQSMKDSASKRSDDSQALAHKEATKAAMGSDLESHKEEKGATAKELMAALKYVQSLHTECDWLLQYFDVRKEARAGEVESLEQAKAVLSGADFSLLQNPGTPRHTQAHPGTPKQTQAHPSTPKHTQAHPGTPTHTQAHRSTPKRTQAHPSTPRHNQAHPGTPKHTQAHPSTPKHTQAHPSTPRHTQAHPRTPKHTKAHPSTPKHTQAHPSTPRHTKAAAARKSLRGRVL